jgi:hypothetical protein
VTDGCWLEYTGFVKMGQPKLSEKKQRSYSKRSFYRLLSFPPDHFSHMIIVFLMTD